MATPSSDHNKQASSAQLDRIKMHAVEHAANAVMITDRQGDICYVNQAFEVMTGWHSHEILGRNPRFLKSKATHPEVHQELWQTIKHGAIWCGQVTNRRKDGSEYIEEMTVTPITDNDGTITHFIAIKQDKSEVIRLAQQAYHDGQVFHAVFHSAGIAMLTVDPRSLVIRDINQAAQEFFPAFWQIQANTPLTRALPHWPERMMQETLLNAATQQRVPKVVLQSQSAHNTNADIELRLAPFGLADERQVLIILHDISEEARFRRQLELSHRTVHTILETVSDALVVCNEKHCIIFWNRTMVEATGISNADAIGQPIDQLAIPWNPHLVQTAISTAQRCGEGSITACSLRPPEKDPRLFSFRVSLILAPEGVEGGLVFLGHDITSQRQEQARRLQAEKLESIGQLAAGIAHEINTPIQYVGDNLQFLGESIADIQGIIGKLQELVSSVEAQTDSQAIINDYRDMAKRVDLAFLLDELQPAYEQAQEGVRRVAKIVAAMREFSHPGSGEFGPVDLNRAIQSTIVVARNEYKYMAEVQLELDINLPHIHGDGGALNQVFLNILVNAAHAVGQARAADGPLGTITFTTRSRSDGVDIFIADSGCGIPEEHKSRIFDPFFTTKAVGEGTGQGLSMVYDVVVRRHKGTIRCYDNHPQGTVFHLTLPLDPPGTDRIDQLRGQL